MNKESTVILTAIGLMVFLNLIEAFDQDNFISAGLIALIIFFIYKQTVKFLFKNKINQSINNSIELVFKITFLLLSIPSISFGLYYLFLGILGRCQQITFFACIAAPFFLIMGIVLLLLVIRKKHLKQNESSHLEKVEDQKMDVKTILIILAILLSGSIVYKFFPNLYVSPPLNATEEQKDDFYACYENTGNERYSCIADVAVKYLDEKICEKIPIATGDGWNSGCYREVAIAKRDPELCKKADEWSEKICYSEIAVLTSDLVLCEKAEEYAKCFEELGTTREEAQKEINKIVYEQEQNIGNVFSNDDLDLTIKDSEKFSNVNNYLNKISLTFKIKNKKEYDIKIPSISVGKLFIFKLENSNIISSTIINKDVRDETDGFNIIIEPGEEREFAIELEIRSLRHGDIAITLESFNYFAKNDIHKLDLSLLLIKDTSATCVGLLEKEEAIAYVREINDGESIEIITTNGNNFLVNESISSFISKYSYNSGYHEKMDLYKDRINSLNHSLGSPVGCTQGIITLSYITQDGFFRVLKIKGLDPC